MHYDLNNLPSKETFFKDVRRFTKTSGANLFARKQRTMRLEVNKCPEVDLQVLVTISMFATSIAKVYAYEFIDECAYRYRNANSISRYVGRIEKKFDMWHSRAKRMFAVTENEWIQSCMSAVVDILRPYADKYAEATKEAIYAEGISDSSLYAKGEVATALLLMAKRTYDDVALKNSQMPSLYELNPTPMLEATSLLWSFVKKDRFDSREISYESHKAVLDALTELGRFIVEPNTMKKAYEVADDFCNVPIKDRI